MASCLHCGEWITSHKWVCEKCHEKVIKGVFNETRRKRDEVKGKLAVALKEIKLRKQYESFLKSVIRSGESLSDKQTFEWFCEMHENTLSRKERST